MNQPRSEAACSSVPLDLRVSRLTEAEEYLRKEADFNRSWADGRRGKGAGLAKDVGRIKTKKHTVTLDAFSVAFLELLGNGNLSRGIREAARRLAPNKTTPNAKLKGAAPRNSKPE